MTSGTETVIVSTTITGGAVQRQGANQMALIAPHTPSGSEVDPNVVKKVRLISQAEEFFGPGLLTDGFTAARASGAPFAFLVGAEETTGATETFGTASVVSQGTLANIPISAITGVTVDTVAKTVAYTHLDPWTQSVAAGTVLVNTDTGKFKSGTATSGSGAGIVFTESYTDWDSAFEVLDLEAYEYHSPAGVTLKAQNIGIINKFLAHADEANKMVAVALDSGVAPADVEALVESIRNARLFIIAAYYTGDLTSAVTAHRASRPVNSTAKEQVAPLGVTYNDSYLRTDYDDEESPASGSFHEFGVNAVYRDRSGNYRITNDRASTNITDALRFHSSKRMVRLAEVNLEDELLAARRASDTRIPMSEAGLAVIRSVIEGVLGELRDQNIIDLGVLSMPSIADISADDRAKRIVDQVEVSIRLTGQVHLVKLALNVEV